MIRRLNGDPPPGYACRRCLDASPVTRTAVGRAAVGRAWIQSDRLGWSDVEQHVLQLGQRDSRACKPRKLPDRQLRDQCVDQPCHSRAIHQHPSCIPGTG